MTNVVLFHTHDTGRYIEPYGYDVPTPTLQRLAEEGALFRRAYCAAPTCSPSRGALMTGQVPHSNGLNGLAHRGFSLEEYDQHLASYLSRNGFETALCGVEHESPEDGDPGELGYRRVPSDPELSAESDDDGDEFEAPHERARRDYATARAAAAYVRGETDRVRATPYFLSVGFHNTHRPFPHDDPAVDPAFVRPPEPIPDAPTTREEMAAFATAAGYVDDCVDHVLDALRESGTLEETLVVFTTDHGPAFPRMKCSLFEGGTGVSLIMRFPDRWTGRTVDDLVSHIDVYPTLCDYLSLETPPWVQGSSLLETLRDENETHRSRDEVFSEVTYHAAYEPKRCIRTDRYTYIRRFDDTFETTVLPNVDDGPTKRFLLECEHGLRDRTLPREALYDRHHDPNERENLIDEPAYAEVREDLAARLRAWMSDTDDPLLDGPVPKPDGARADRRCGVHPDEEFEPSDAR